MPCMFRHCNCNCTLPIPVAEEASLWMLGTRKWVRHDKSSVQKDCVRLASPTGLLKYGGTLVPASTVKSLPRFHSLLCSMGYKRWYSDKQRECLPTLRSAWQTSCLIVFRSWVPQELTSLRALQLSWASKSDAQKLCIRTDYVAHLLQGLQQSRHSISTLYELHASWSWTVVKLSTID